MRAKKNGTVSAIQLKMALLSRQAVRILKKTLKWLQKKHKRTKELEQKVLETEEIFEEKKKAVEEEDCKS
jgi:hypothetical protein